MLGEALRARRGAAILTVVLLLGGREVCAADDPVQELQEKVRELMQQVEKLTAELAEQKERAASDRQGPDSQTPTLRMADGLTLEDPRGQWSLRFNGRIQADYRSYVPDGAAADTFSIRRARIGAGLTVFKSYQMYVEGEFVNGSATGTTTQSAALVNGWMELGWFDRARI